MSKSALPAVLNYWELPVSRRSKDVTCPRPNGRLTKRQGRRDRRDRCSDKEIKRRERRNKLVTVQKRLRRPSSGEGRVALLTKQRCVG